MSLVFLTKLMSRLTCYCNTDDRPVASSEVPGPSGVRELQTAAAGARGRRPGDPPDTVPHAPIHRHGCRGLAGG